MWFVISSNHHYQNSFFNTLALGYFLPGNLILFLLQFLYRLFWKELKSLKFLHMKISGNVYIIVEHNSCQ